MEEITKVRMLLRKILTNQNSYSVFNYEALKLIINHSANDLLQITPILSHSSKVFLLSFGKNNPNFVLKIKEANETNKQRKLGIEVNACKILAKKIKVPEVILYGILYDYEVAIYSYLDGKTADKEFLTEEKIIHIWKLTLDIQSTLSRFNEYLNLEIWKDQKFTDKIIRYTLKFLGREIRLKDFKVIDEYLNTGLLKTSHTFFSDRGPTNWIIGKNNIIPIDFDLLLIEPRLSDFVQFIDDHRLSVKYGRNNLIDKCLSFLNENNIYFCKKDFHWCAIYRNLIQGALFYKINKTASKFYYERALTSAIIIDVKSVKKEVKKILNEVAWI